MVNPKGSIKYILLFCFLHLLNDDAWADHDHFARMEVMPARVYAGQCVTVRISVYTTTWFTQAPDFGDYQVRNSFTFKTGRPWGSYETIDGKRYAVLNYEYLVFPFQPGKTELPALDIRFESPPDGDYRGKSFNVTTNAASLVIDSLPAGTFVADRVKLTGSWNRPPEDIRVGDVLDWVINIHANGTPANVIPALDPEFLSIIGVYPGKPELVQSIGDHNEVISVRTEHYSILFQDSGLVSLPEIHIRYFQPASGQWKEASLKTNPVKVSFNPGLSELIALQDSLNKAMQEDSADAQQPVSQWKDRIKWQWSVLLAMGIFLVVLLFRMISLFRRKKENYYRSEKYFFRKILSSIRKNDNWMTIRYFYEWYFSFVFTGESGNDPICGIPEEVKTLSGYLFSEMNAPDSGLLSGNMQEIMRWKFKKFRNTCLKSRHNVDKDLFQINPS